jgi:hypothetical protein
MIPDAGTKVSHVPITCRPFCGYVEVIALD